MQSESALIQRYREGDEEAFRALFEGYVPALNARIQRRLVPLVLRKVSIRDVLQDIRIIAFERRDIFRGESKDEFRKWLLGIASRHLGSVVQHYAQTGKRAANHEISRDRRNDTNLVAGNGPTPSQNAVGREAEQLAGRALAGLSQESREVLRMCREDGLSLREVAHLTGRSYEATKKLRQRALDEFLERFRRLGGHHAG